MLLLMRGDVRGESETHFRIFFRTTARAERDDTESADERHSDTCTLVGVLHECCYEVLYMNV